MLRIALTDYIGNEGKRNNEMMDNWKSSNTPTFQHSIFASFITYCILILSSCHSGPEKATFSDTPTSGEVTIVCDESYQPLISVESDTFHSIYQYAKVHVNYLPEAEAFKQLVTNDSIRLIVSARELNTAEKDYFNSRKLIPRTTKVAIDAVALVINNENNDSLIKYEQLKSIINGETNSWRKLSAATNLKPQTS